MSKFITNLSRIVKEGQNQKRRDQTLREKSDIFKKQGEIHHGPLDFNL
jgi:hypothetical protein